MFYLKIIDFGLSRTEREDLMTEYVNLKLNFFYFFGLFTLFYLRSYQDGIEHQNY